MRHGRKLLYPLFVTGILAAFVAVAVANPSFIQSLRLMAFDGLQNLAPRAYDIRQPVRVVDIDDDSLAKLGQWPWPRTVMATLLQKIGEAGAASITTDIMYAEPDRTSLVRYTKDLGADKALLRQQQLRVTQLESQVAAEVRNAIKIGRAHV